MVNISLVPQKKLVYVYDDRDHSHWEELHTALAPLKSEVSFTEWHEREIDPGADREKEILEHLDEADVILFLVSSDFFRSEHRINEQLPRAIKRTQNGQAVGIAIILRPCVWHHDRLLRQLTILPPDGAPVTEQNHDEAFRDIAAALRGIIGPWPIEVNDGKHIAIHKDQRRFEFPWALDTGGIQMAETHDLIHWKKLHTEAEQLFVVHIDLVYGMLEGKPNVAVSDGLVKKTKDFAMMIDGYPFQKCPFAPTFSNLPRCLAAIDECLDNYHRNLDSASLDAEYQGAIVLARQMGAWMMGGLHIADQMLENHFKNLSGERQDRRKSI